MLLNSKFNIGETVYIKTRNGVSKGQIQALALDCAKQTQDSFCFAYLIWESDRLDNAGHHVWAYEGNLALTFDEAYYNADKRFPWDILPDLQRKDMLLFIEKLKQADISVIPNVD